MSTGVFELDGHQFGGGPGQPVRVAEFDPGSRTIITADSHAVGMLGRRMGRDQVDGPEWTWKLAIEQATDGDLFDGLDALAAAWAPTETRWLRYTLPGRARRVLGRTRRFRARDVVWWDGVQHQAVDVTFQLTDPRSFDDVAQQVTLTIVPATVGGLEAPLVAPLSTVRSSEPRAGHVTSHGLAPAPLTVTFTGPVTDPVVRGDGWEIGLTGSLAYDQSVTVDALAGTAVRQDGASVAGRLTRRTFLQDAALTPGLQEITFGGSDPTGTATATITWRDAWWSI